MLDDLVLYEVISKIRFDVLLGEGLGSWKTSQWRFPFQNRFMVPNALSNLNLSSPPFLPYLEMPCNQYFQPLEATNGGILLKKVLLEILQNSQKKQQFRSETATRAVL